MKTEILRSQNDGEVFRDPGVGVREWCVYVPKLEKWTFKASLHLCKP